MKDGFHGRFSGEFLTEVELPVRMDPESIRARYHDGFFTVEIRKVDPFPDEGL